MSKQLIYFGCKGGNAGHGFYSPGMVYLSKYSIKIPGVNNQLWSNIDGLFTPADDLRQGAMRIVLIGPAAIIIAWHDYTGDSRPGSNSALITCGYKTCNEIVEEAYKGFKEIFERQPSLILPHE